MAVLDMLLSKDGVFAAYAEHPIQFIVTCLIVAVNITKDGLRDYIC